MNDAMLIVVITDVEYKIVRAAMEAVEAPEYVGSAFVERGDLAGKSVVLCKIRDMGTKTIGSIGVALNAVLDFVKPRCVVEIGICFSLKKELRIGDVCLCRTTCDYEYQKIKDGHVLHRARSLSAPHPLFSQLSHFALNNRMEFAVLPGVYACGDKVVDDPNFKKNVLKAVPDALAGDMESYTLALACNERNLPWVVIKGASDDGVNKEDDNQSVAAANAIKFFESFLSTDESTTFAAHLEIDSTLSGIDYKDISREIFGKKDLVSEPHDTVRTAFEAHYHPDLGGAWASIFIYRAHSVPETLKTFLRQRKSAPLRVDVCLVSREHVSPQRLTAYEKQLKSAGCKEIYISTIKEFVFDRVVKGRLPKVSVGIETEYIDQKIYRNEGEPILTRQYMASILSSKESGKQNKFKPINLILGAGGIGKTTLCGNLVKGFERYGSKQEFLLLITKHDILRAYSGAAVDSITDLYREYRRGNAEVTDSINDANFELALSCGSLIMMVDGIDEIEAALSGKFNMEGFIDSIRQLDSILQSCKVLLTSRNVGVERFLSLDNTDIFHLKGFTTDDVGDYLQKQSSEVASAVNRIIPKIKTRHGFVNPYLLSIATKVFADGDGGEDMAELTTRLNTSAPFEYILARLLSREIEKQTLGITVDEYYELLEHLIVECGNSMPKEDLGDYINLMLKGDPKEVTNYLKCLLFQEESGHVSISHEEYTSLICTKFGVNALRNTKKISAYDVSCFMKALGADHNDILGIKEAIVQSLWKCGVEPGVVNNNFREYLRMFKAELNGKIMAPARAIYALHIMALNFNRVKDGSEAASVLVDLHGEKTIKKMYVLGGFPLVDFRGLAFEDCEFNGYQRFLTCKANSETKFKRSRFLNCNGKSTQGDFTEEMFDEYCTLDEGMRLAISHSADKREGRSARLSADLKRVLKAMRVGLGFGSHSLNRIKQTAVLASGTKVETFLDQLCRTKILSFDTNSSLYQVIPSTHKDAVVLCEEGHTQGEISRAIRELAG